MDEPFQARAMGLSHIGHHPIRSGGGLLQLRAELILLRRVPALSMARPLVVNVY